MKPSPQCPPEFSPGTVLPLAVCRRWLKACGRGVRIYRGARLVAPDQIVIGEATQIDEGVWIFAGQGVALGCHVHLAFGSSISGGGWCEIGDFASIGAGVRLVTGSDLVEGKGLTNPTIPEALRTVRRGVVRIGKHAVIFTGSIVLPGVTVGEGAVVGAGSVVHHDLKPWGVYAGNPLVQVGRRPSATLRRIARQLTERGAR